MPPLDGILVADFSRVLAGPLAAMLLGDLGADVIKVERPDGGDDTRAWGPPWRDERRDLLPRRSTATSARSRSTCATRATARSRARWRERADVLIESFRPGLMATLGLDGDDAARGGNPGLVSCSVTAFGTGPRPPRAARLRLPAAGDGRADVGHRRAGRAAAEGRHRGRRPRLRAARPPTASRRRCVERARTGRGRHVEVSLMDSALTCLLNQGTAWVAGGRGRPPARQPPPEHRALRDATRPPTGRSRSRSATTASSRGCARRSGCPSSPATSASPPTRRASRTPTSSRPRSRPCCARSPPTHWLARAARGEGPRRPDQRRRRGVRARRGARHGARRGASTAPARSARRCASTASARRSAARRPRLDEHGDEIRAWLASLNDSSRPRRRLQAVSAPAAELSRSQSCALPLT